MGIVMGIDGLTAVIFAMEGELNGRKTKTGVLVQTAGILTEGEAKQNAPVDTGRLRASIKYQKQDTLSCTVGTNVNYAVFQEYGTHKMAPHPFLTPAFVKIRRELMDEAEKLAKTGSSGWTD